MSRRSWIIKISYNIHESIFEDNLLLLSPCSTSTLFLHDFKKLCAFHCADFSSNGHIFFNLKILFLVKKIKLIGEKY